MSTAQYDDLTMGPTSVANDQQTGFGSNSESDEEDESSSERDREDAEEAARAIQGLTLYEMKREPLVLLPEDGPAVSVEKYILSKDLACPVCLNPMSHPVAVMECMHRFCRDCIEQALRKGLHIYLALQMLTCCRRKECPTCRTPVVSRRNLRYIAVQNGTKIAELMTLLVHLLLN